jgi:hypothetical protein
MRLVLRCRSFPRVALALLLPASPRGPHPGAPAAVASRSVVRERFRLHVHHGGGEPSPPLEGGRLAGGALAP